MAQEEPPSAEEIIRQMSAKLAPAEGLWASAKASGSLEATLDRFAAEYGVSLPLDDLLRQDPYPVMASLPRGYETLQAADGRYYFAQGNFFRATESGYQVAAPPIGIEVPKLPSGAEMVKANGQQYFVYNDICYQGLYSGSGIVYRVVEEPKS